MYVCMYQVFKPFKMNSSATKEQESAPEAGRFPATERAQAYLRDKVTHAQTSRYIVALHSRGSTYLLDSYMLKRPAILWHYIVKIFAIYVVALHSKYIYYTCRGSTYLLN
jgi:hypothetical protein